MPTEEPLLVTLSPTAYPRLQISGYGLASPRWQVFISKQWRREEGKIGAAAA
jgi:hypothetical protein